MSPNKSELRDPDQVLQTVEVVRWIISQATSLPIVDLLAEKMMPLALERQFEILSEAAGHVSAVTHSSGQTLTDDALKLSAT